MSRIRVTREPLTYERHGTRARHSFFADWAAVAHNPGSSPDAEARLERHRAEMKVELPALEKRMATEAPDVEYRVNPSRVDGQGGYFSPPLWSEEHFATAPRPKRVLAGLIPSFDLPDGVGSVHLPRITTGTKAGTPADVSPAPEQDFTDAAVESYAATVTGNADVALQLLEQSPLGAALDHSILKDMGEAADENLEEKLFVGTGSSANREITGILNLPTGAGLTSAVTFTSASPKGYEIFSELGKVAGQLGDARRLPPECWVMRTSRWAALGSAEDEEKLPLAVPGHQALAPVAYTFDDSHPAVAPPVLGWPTYLSDAIPNTLGAGANQDIVLAIRPSDHMLFESDTKTMVLTEVLSGTMQVRFSLRRYAAVLWRYPTGVSYLQGTGLVVPSEY